MRITAGFILIVWGTGGFAIGMSDLLLWGSHVTPLKVIFLAILLLAVVGGISAARKGSYWWAFSGATGLVLAGIISAVWQYAWFKQPVIDPAIWLEVATAGSICGVTGLLALVFVVKRKAEFRSDPAGAGLRGDAGERTGPEQRPGRTRMSRKKLAGIIMACAVALASIVLIAVNVCFPRDLEIRTWHDLHAIRRNLGGHHRLMNDLDATTAGYEKVAGPTANGGKGWEPIGNPLAARFEGEERIVGAHPFAGSLDGQGYEIRDLFINRPDENYVGLFRHVGDEGVIKNVGVGDATVNGEHRVGGLSGLNSGSVSTAFFSGNVTGSWPVGGLVGENQGGTVSSSNYTGSVAGDRFVGGLVGFSGNWGTVSNSYYTGSVTGDGYVGGLVGANGAGTVSSCHATGSVVGEGTVGGLVGVNADTVSKSYFSGNVTGDGPVGGLVGHNFRTVSNSYYDYDAILINGENIITIGALSGADFEQWLANDRYLDVNERLRQDNGYYLIDDIEDLKQLLAFGQEDSLKFSLNADLDLATEAGLYIPYLAGEFDGNGHSISNVSFNSDCISNVGLFGHLAIGGKVTELGVENADITGFGSVGGLLGLNEGMVSSSYSNGTVTGHKYVGGLVGYSRGTLSNSYSSGTVTGDEYVGGLVGYNIGTVSNSYSTGSVTGKWSPGGLVGQEEGGTVNNSFWDVEPAGMEDSDGGTGRTTVEMKDIATFTDTQTEGLDEPWDMIAVAPGAPNPAYTWNIVDGQTYPFLSWESVS